MLVGKPPDLTTRLDPELVVLSKRDRLAPIDDARTLSARRS